ncbi:tRNA (adenosine(37)-N6)-threonylcarbamoyltransferase complex dimerization subunit type 1 TsaB [Ignavibacteria bacterium]|nr:tRNA (adenosine(37)-N6)-threonylcarbamoyltransferase complex dimerization subunit type 1 TsaB [Bacteroidota bacterium]MCZ2133468.1 tRNA (adenosine(37)-N6)-threonylcarbamoyltransferase complex dimerization subunit type 1 TsaB [Bacteroidota bacterium]
MTDNNFLLAIESGAATCGVCLVRNGEIWGEYSIFAPYKHDKMLAEFTRRLIADADISFENIAAVAVNSGPGSFTGLRVSAAFAKGLCLDFIYAVPPKLIAVPSLDAFACAAEEFARTTDAASVIAAIHSHKDIAYIRRYTADLQPLTEIELVNSYQLDSIVEPHDIVCGTAAFFTEKGMKLSGLNRPTPRFIARLGMRLLSAGIFTEALSFSPLYVQEFTPKTGAKKNIVSY